MELVLYELKKMFVYRKGIVFILAFLILKLASLCLLDTPANPLMEANKEVYQQYLSQLSGQLTAEKERFFADESDLLWSADSTIQTSYEKYYNGEITEMELEQTVFPLREKSELKNGFDAIYQEYLYARQSPTDRYILYTNGWAALLWQTAPDFLLIVLLFLLIAPIYCEDSKCQMDVLSATMMQGGKAQFAAKTIVALTVTLLLAIGSEITEALFYLVKYGLPCGDYPLQSLSCFGAATKLLSLAGGAWFLLGLKVIGYLLLCVTILAETVFFKKYAITLLISISALLIPLYGFSEALLYALPLPAAFLAPIGFLRGTQLATSEVSGQSVIIFQERSWGQIIFMVFAALGIILFLLLAIRRATANQWQRTSRRRRKVRAGVLAALMFLSTLTGCVPSAERDPSTFNIVDHQHYETDRYLVYFEDSGSSGESIVVEDKETGRKEPLVRDPFAASDQVLGLLYGRGDYVYYIKMTADQSETIMYVMYDKLLLQEVDLRDFSERTVLKANLNEKSLLGDAFAAQRDDLIFYMTALAFFVDDHYAYFISSEDISRVSLWTGRREKLLETSLITDAAYDGESIYYLNEKSELIRYYIDGEYTELIPGVIAKRFYLYGQTLYYLNRRERGAIYKLNLASMEGRRLSSQTATWLMGDDRYLFFKAQDSGNLCRIDVGEGSETATLYTSPYFFLFPKASKLYLPGNGSCTIIDEQSLLPL